MSFLSELVLSDLRPLAGFLFWHVIVTTVVLACVLVILLLARRWSAQTRHSLALLGLTKVFLPGVVLVPFALALGLRLPQVRVLPSQANKAPQVERAAISPSPEGPPVQSTLPLFTGGIWLVGAGALALTWFVARCRFAVKVRRSRVPASAEERAMAEEIRDRLRCRRPLRVWRTAAASAPLAAGVFRPAILLPPEGLDQLAGPEKKGILAHEIAHIKRLDPVLSLFSAAAVVLFWFNPLAWLVRRRLEGEAERCCDQQALGVVPAQDYRLGIAKVCHPGAIVALVGTTCAARAELAQRMEDIMKGDHMSQSRFRQVIISTTALIVLLLGSLAATLVTDRQAWAQAPTQTHAFPYTFTIHTIKVADGKFLSELEIRELASRRIISQPRIMYAVGEPAIVRSGTQREGVSSEIKLTLVMGADLKGKGILELIEGDRIVNQKEFVFSSRPGEGQNWQADPAVEMPFLLSIDSTQKPDGLFSTTIFIRNKTTGEIKGPVVMGHQANQPANLGDDLMIGGKSYHFLATLISQPSGVGMATLELHEGEKLVAWQEQPYFSHDKVK